MNNAIEYHAQPNSDYTAEQHSSPLPRHVVSTTQRGLAFSERHRHEMFKTWSFTMETQLWRFRKFSIRDVFLWKVSSWNVFKKGWSFTEDVCTFLIRNGSIIVTFRMKCTFSKKYRNNKWNVRWMELPKSTFLIRNAFPKRYRHEMFKSWSFTMETQLGRFWKFSIRDVFCSEKFHREMFKKPLIIYWRRMHIFDHKWIHNRNFSDRPGIHFPSGIVMKCSKLDHLQWKRSYGDFWSFRSEMYFFWKASSWNVFKKRLIIYWKCMQKKRTFRTYPHILISQSFHKCSMNACQTTNPFTSVV